ncbi:MAG: biopolymer transporter ExbD, partial [Nitrospirota bacterium]|nr:biopolymer transporter ExbD [Nitrospirota bacterium]
TISVKKNGDIYMDEERVKINELEQLIRDLKAAKGGKLPLVLRGDSGVEYKYVVAVLDILQRIPVEDLAIATKPTNEP